jgi:hypothetical protein
MPDVLKVKPPEKQTKAAKKAKRSSQGLKRLFKSNSLESL